jgi:hypothetical protein
VTPLEERLRRSLAEFYAMLDCMHFTGASQVIEVQHLKILVGRYPDQARLFLAAHDNARNGAPARADKDAGAAPDLHGWLRGQR